MNRFLLTISSFALMLVFASQAFCQQLPIYQHSFLIRSAYNPAEVLNKTSDLSVYILRGDQFTRFDGGFVNNYLNIASPLRKKNIGIGVELASRSYGIINQLSAGLSYAYRAKINTKTNLTFGARLGFMEHKFNKYYLVIYQDNDAVINDIPRGVVIPNGNLGMTLNTQFGSLEFSVPQLLSNSFIKLSSNSNQNIILSPHYFARYSYDFLMNEGYLKLTPILAARFLPHSVPQYEAGVTAWVNELFWINANYRSNYSASLGVGFRLFDSWIVGYSHDRPIQNQYSFYNSSNEIVLGYNFNKTRVSRKNRNKNKEIEWNQANNNAKQGKKFDGMKMDSISPVYDPEIAREFLKLQLSNRQLQDSLNAIASRKNEGYNYKNVLIQINLVDSLFDLEISANQKTITLRPRNTTPANSDTIEVAKNSKSAKEIEEDRLIEELNENRKDKIKIVRNTQPNEKVYVELSGEDSPRGYYLITGVFSTLERAQKFRWQDGSENAKIIINKKNNYFYVVQMYSPSKSIDELKKILLEYRAKNKPIWILDY